MSTPRGWAGQTKNLRTTAQHATVTPAGKYKNALDVIDRSTVFNVATDAAEAGSTSYVINATSHLAKVGDRIRFTSGVHSGTEAEVYSVTTNAITLAFDLDAAIATGVTFDIMRPISMTVGSDGTITVSTTPGPLQFVLDGVDTEVNEDTVTPANNRPLPVKLVSFSGDINVTADSLDVSMSASGASPDSVRIGDGTDELAINGSGEALVNASQSGTWNITNVSGTISLPTGAATSALQTTGNTSLSSIDGKTPALGQALMAASVPVAIASDQSAIPASQSGTWNITNVSGTVSLPTGAATEATLASIDGNVIKADTDNVTISAALPAGTNNIGDVDVASLPSIPAGTNNIGDVDVLTLPSIPAGTNNIGDVDVLTLPAIPAGSNLIGSVDVNLDVIDFLDTNPVLDTSSTNIPASGGSPLTAVASLAANVKKIRVNDTTGAFIGVYTGAAASEVLQAVVGPGMDGHLEVRMSSGERVSLRNMANSAISVGELCLQFLG